MEHGLATVLSRIETLHSFAVADDGEEVDLAWDEIEAAPANE
jgi:hypothetical protein